VKLRYYRLKDGRAEECNSADWTAIRCFLKEADGVHVADDRVGRVRVSTVLLLIDHAFGPGPPVIFETMIFGGWHDQRQWRYTSMEAARCGHVRALAMVRRLRFIPGALQTACRKTSEYGLRRWWQLKWRIQARKGAP
jgi:hypothetical protein